MGFKIGNATHMNDPFDHMANSRVPLGNIVDNILFLLAVLADLDLNEHPSSLL